MRYTRTFLRPIKGSQFVFGPRQTGKSTLLKSWLKGHDLYINLLPQREFLQFSTVPGRFRNEVLHHLQKHPQSVIGVDEIQRIPDLLNEIHDLIETHKARFILTGSSARKLKRDGANLLAGRAKSGTLYPLTIEELSEHFDLERALLWGTLPTIWSEDRAPSEHSEFLNSYTETYLKEEIQQEALVRNIGSFYRFLEVVASSDGEIVNFSSVARDCAVSVKTVQSYYSILEDTFISYKLEPYLKSARKRLVAHPKYYLFDPGVTNALKGSSFRHLNPVDRGRRFEQFMILQILAALSYQKSHLELRFWRTNTGNEVDLLILDEGKVRCAVEFKSSENVQNKDSSHLNGFSEEHPKAEKFIVVPFGRPMSHQKVSVVSALDFMTEILPKLMK